MTEFLIVLLPLTVLVVALGMTVAQWISHRYFIGNVFDVKLFVRDIRPFLALWALYHALMAAYHYRLLE